MWTPFLALFIHLEDGESCKEYQPYTLKCVETPLHPFSIQFGCCGSLGLGGEVLGLGMGLQSGIEGMGLESGMRFVLGVKSWVYRVRSKRGGRLVGR